VSKRKKEDSIKANYLDFSKRESIYWRYKNDSHHNTKGTFKVWTKTVGNPTIKVLLLVVLV
jgi:hypothetical protein